jgi:hypothetical protein
MCLAEDHFDSLTDSEQLCLRQTAANEWPSYQFRVEINREGLRWVVLEPLRMTTANPRFTICRVHPCIMVLIEDEDARRQFCSASNVADAIGFIRLAADQALLAAMNAHPAHTHLQ